MGNSASAVADTAQRVRTAVAILAKLPLPAATRIPIIAGICAGAVLVTVVEVFRKPPKPENPTVEAIQAYLAGEEMRLLVSEDELWPEKESGHKGNGGRSGKGQRMKGKNKRTIQEECDEILEHIRVQEEAAESQRKADEVRQELEETRHNLKNGIQPVVWPTKQEFEAAKVRVEYQRDLLHFAISGPSGSGKSSLINAFRGLKTKSQEAAPVGAVETTTTITRYPDARQETEYRRFVWYDVPGAGTINIPSWQYFNQQGLFIFDFIILVYDARFTEIDADILENCHRFDIPVFIVRSKADQHIANMMIEDDDLTYTEARDRYIADTRQNLESNLKKRNLYDENTRCYIVSSTCLYDQTKSTETTNNVPPARKRSKEVYIDEEQLLADLLKTGIQRRYSESAHITIRSSATTMEEIASSVPEVMHGGSSPSTAT
ncbi:interferon-inducible GTPase-domain-containing protein [Tricharina praecox]|uniref:interferon-inducible GTPase-domain-containing protein n=1 Tax=Tricharina praecox TaxID=43433 RepID=UPI002220998A|nr:interferon-inducible GTPase-domain-containing protein [Tricharina praecox]KAI5855522.1 interferon-inducible GTPase-domain-containing protein [Tricharina praecox]